MFHRVYSYYFPVIDVPKYYIGSFFLACGRKRDYFLSDVEIDNENEWEGPVAQLVRAHA